MTIAYLFAAILALIIGTVAWFFGFFAAFLTACAALVGLWWAAAILTDTI